MNLEVPTNVHGNSDYAMQTYLDYHTEARDWSEAVIFPSRNQSMVINVTRTYRISEFLVTRFNDTIMILNNDSKPFNGILIYYEKKFFEKMNLIHVIGKPANEEEKITLNWYIFSVSENYVGIAIKFDRFLFEKDRYAVILLCDMLNMIFFKAVGSEIIFQLNVTQRPLLPYAINFAKIRCIPPTQVNVLFDEITPTKNKGRKGNEVFWKLKEIEPFDEAINPNDLTKIYFVYKHTKLPLRILYVIRNVRVSLSGRIHVSDKLGISVISPIEQEALSGRRLDADKITIGLVPNVKSKNVVVKDYFGKLSIDEKAGSGIFENYTFIEITFRNPLIGDEVYEISIDYDIPMKDNVIYKNGTFHLKIPLTPIINATISLVIFKITSPYYITIANNKLREVAVFTKSVWKREVFLIINHHVVTWEFAKLLPSLNRILHIRYTVSIYPFLDALTIIFQFILIGLIVGILISKEIGKKKIALKIEEMPELRKRREELIRFIALYEEYLSIEEELQKELTTKAVVKRPSAHILSGITARQEELRKKRSALYHLGDELKKDIDIEPIIDELRKIETRIDLARRKIIEDLRRYLRGAIKRSEFLSEAEMTLKEINSNISRKRRFLNNLKEILLVKYSLK